MVCGVASGLVAAFATALVPARAHAAEATNPPATAASVAAVPASAGVGVAAVDSLFERIRTLEQTGRGRPEEAIPALRAIAVEALPGSRERLEALLVQGLLLGQVGDAVSVEATADALDAWPPSSDEPLAAAAARLVRGWLISTAGHQARADRWGDDAMAKLPGAVDGIMRLRFLLALTTMKQRAGRLEDSVRYGLDALALADRIAPDWRRAWVRTELGYSYFLAGQGDAARRLTHEAITLAAGAGDDLMLARAYNILSIVLDGTAGLEAERVAMERAIDYARRAGARGDEVFFQANLADIYLKRGDYATALKLSEDALVQVRALKDTTGETLALANIGLALISMKRFADGRRYLDEAISIDERRGATASVQGTLEEMGVYYEKAGELTQAITAFHRARQLQDELTRRDEQRAIVELQERYDNERRNRELELLNRDNQIKTEALRRRTLQQSGWALAAAAGLLALALVGLLLQRQRQSNRRLRWRNERLRVASERDPLTGLANRRQLQAEQRAAAAAGHGVDGTLFLIDIDEFKRINDGHGHAGGDAVLVEVARRLRLTLRADDHLARWGGEEFLVLVQSLGPEAVETLAQRMLDEVGTRPVMLPGGAALQVTASIGFASFPLEPNRLSMSWDGAIDLVDTAMYLAKAHGRNRAYGVRLLIAEREDEVASIGRSLEDAWRAGRVALTLLSGPVPGEAP